jgi:hypothetical protein
MAEAEGTRNWLHYLGRTPDFPSGY